jgi:biotin carboxylase
MHMLLVGAWPELANQLVGLPARVSVLQLPGAGAGRESAWAHRYLEVDYGDTAAAVTSAQAIHREDPIDVVVGLREFSLRAVAAIARQLNVACVPGPAETLGTDKAAVRETLNRAGCRAVGYCRCESAAHIAEFADLAGFPLVVKPVAGAGSAGVHAVVCRGDIGAAWAHAAAAGKDGVLAEQMLIGPEYSAEVRSLAGRHEVVAITEKLTTGPPHFVEIGHLVPARLDDDVAAGLAAEAVRCLDAIGHVWGPTHVELIGTVDGPAVVEINRRLGGDRIWELVALATGRNIMLESLLDAVGEPYHRARRKPRGAAIRFLYAEKPGWLAEQSPACYPRSRRELVRTHILETDGAQVNPPRSSSDRLGYVLTVAPDSRQAAEAADALQQAMLRDLFTPARRSA